ncbi:MAG: hypothetical protein R3Y67_05705 [Eubacteriales bacterium]
MATMPIISFSYGAKEKELFAVAITSAFGLSGTTMESCIRAIMNFMLKSSWCSWHQL